MYVNIHHLHKRSKDEFVDSLMKKLGSVKLLIGLPHSMEFIFNVKSR